MENKLQKSFSPRLTKLQTALWCAMALALTLVARTHGQSVLVGPPMIPAAPNAAGAGGDTNTGDTNQLDSASGSVSAAGAGGFENRNPFQWGPIILHPRVGYGLTYGTGLQSQPGQTSKSAINTVSAGLGLDLGHHWDLNYSAAAAFYSDRKFKNSVNHDLAIHGHTTYEDWGFNLSQSVAISSDPLVETAQQTDQQSYNTSLGASYQINSSLSAAVTAGQQLHSASGFTNSVGSSIDWSLSGSLNYEFGPGVSAGLGAGWGYSKVDIGPDNTYEDVSLNFNWAFARKLSLSLNGGAQIRQFIGSGQPSLVSPTFGATLNYHPFLFTTLYLSASRNLGASFFQNQVTENTTINIGLSQRLFKKYQLSASGGYGLSNYQDTSPGGAMGITGRSDTRTFFSASLSRSFLKRGTAALTYSKSENASNSRGYGYNSDQVGLSLSYSY